MKRTIKIIGLMGVLGVVGYLVVMAWRPAPVRVESAQVQCGPMHVTVDAEGKTRARDRFVVAAPVTGKLSRIRLERGDLVRRDQVLARLEPPPMSPLDPRQLAEAKARVAASEQLKYEAETGIANARANYEQARREQERATKLVESGDISRQEFERVRNAEVTCQQQLEAAQYRARAAAADVEVAKAALLTVERAGPSGQTATVLVRAPVGGRVLRVAEESERVVMAGTPLVELSQPALEIVLDVLSSEAVKIQPGASVWIEGWGGAQALTARVRMLEPQGFTKISALGIEEQRVNVIADFTEAKAPLGDGYRVEARIVIWETKDTMKVPLSALFRTGEKWNVYVVERGMARKRQVETGHRTALEMEILHGLGEGEAVIIHPSNLISDGVRVQITN